MDPSDKTASNALKEKHPEPREVAGKAFLPCEELLPLAYIEVVIATHVESVAQLIKGSTGYICTCSGTMALHSQDYLQRYGSHSARLKDAVAKLTRCIASTIMVGLIIMC